MPPNPVINKDVTKVYINGEWRPPGLYRVKKGDKIIISAKIVNTGDEGLCRIRVYDDSSWSEVASISKTLDTNQTLSLTKEIYINKNMKLAVYAHWYDDTSDVWRTTDLYRHWILNVVPTVESIPTGLVVSGVLVAVGVICGLYYILKS